MKGLMLIAYCILLLLLLLLTIGCDEERIPGVSTEEIRIKLRSVLFVSADEEVFVS